MPQAARDTGTPITVRASEAGDLAAITDIYAHHVRHGTASFELEPPDLAEMTRRRAALLERDLPYLVAERGGAVVGSAGLHPAGASPRRRHAMFLGISVMRAHQRQGVGDALMAALCDYADRWAGVLRLELDVYTDNAAAIALYRKFGFEIEGTHRAYAMRDGAYVDSYSMARFHPKPPTVPTSPPAAA